MRRRSLAWKVWPYMWEIGSLSQMPQLKKGEKRYKATRNRWELALFLFGHGELFFTTTDHRAT
jgi:hypothetical protein